MDKLAKLLEVVNQKDKARLNILNDAVMRNMKAYQNEPTAARKKDWDAAEEGLQKEIDRLWEEYFGSSSRVPDDRFLPNLLEAMRWLQNLGYKIKKSKIYEDKKKGKIYVWPDGRVYKADAELYARKHLILEKSPDLEDAETKDLEELQRKKLHAEVERLRRQIEKYTFEMAKEQNKYMLKADFHKEMARRLLVLEQNLTHFFRSQAPDLVFLVGGQPKKIPDFLDTIITKLHQELNDFASTERYYVVPLEVENETESAEN